MNEQQFKDLLAEHDIILTETQEKQFRRYFELLQVWNERLNLTTIIQKEDVYEKHFFDCLTLSFENELNGKTLCDVGTGAGFPGLVLKIFYPNLKITLVDSLNKRVIFLNEVIKKLIKIAKQVTITICTDELHEIKNPDTDIFYSNQITGELIIPKNVVTIGENAFTNGNKITTLKFDGALDETSLSQALALLQSLSQGHRLIGIISHVAELKSCIDKKVIISKTNQGSKISIEA